jgi:hypothetical protein
MGVEPLCFFPKTTYVVTIFQSSLKQYHVHFQASAAATNYSLISWYCTLNPRPTVHPRNVGVSSSSLQVAVRVALTLILCVMGWVMPSTLPCLISIYRKSRVVIFFDNNERPVLRRLSSIVDDNVRLWGSLNTGSNGSKDKKFKLRHI